MSSEIPDPVQHAMTNFRGNTLTVQELEAAYLAHYDLGPGYPQLDVAGYIRNLYMDDAIEDLSLRFAPFWTPEKQAQVDEDLELSVRRFLRVPARVEGPIRATFSGSIALDRVLSAVLRRARQGENYDGLTVITTTPCIDIMRLFLEERSDIRPSFVQSRLDGVLGRLDVNAVVDRIRAQRRDHPKGAIAVLLSSPENPTGQTWSEDELRLVAGTCTDTDATLIMDHCFAVAGVQEAGSVCRIWDLNDPGCQWLSVWDTGKTFGLNEDKLGFILCGTPEMAQVVDEALAVTQFGVARRQKMFFAELLRRASFYGHTEELRELCQENVATCVELAPDWISSSPVAGSLLLLDISQSGLSDEALRLKLLDAGIGVIAGNVFFHDDWRPSHYVRLALARRPEYFADALERFLVVAR